MGESGSMLDEDLVKVLEVDEEVLELMAASVVGVHMAIERAYQYKIQRDENVPYSHFVSTFIFQFCCWLTTKGASASNIKAIVNGLADMAELHMKLANTEIDKSKMH
jgi:hypothetical protein